MKITFHGAAQSVTGSKHLIELNNGKRILLDCGLFQGQGDQSDEWNTHFGFKPSSVDFLILSHAHIDHCGLIPRLVAEGFTGEIISTPATKELCEILLEDSAKIQESDAKFNNKWRSKKGWQPVKPLYTIQDTLTALIFFKTIKYGQEHELMPGVKLVLKDAGHIIGSASVHLDITENEKTTSISFSGDVGRYNDLILKSPQPFRPADYILLESTYGNSAHKDTTPIANALLEIINETCVVQKGKLIIPAFSVGRTQEILYALNSLELEEKLPDIKYIVDSPLSEKATQVIKSFPKNFNDDVKDVLKIDDDPFHFKGLSFVEDGEESIALNDDSSPMVIISASGMAEGGRVKHHIKNNIEKPHCTILLVGYSEPSSLAGRLKRGENPVQIFGDDYQVKARIASLESMSAHADQDDLLNFLSGQDKEKVKQIFLVHGETETQEAFKDKLNTEGFKHVEIPHRHQSFEI